MGCGPSSPPTAVQSGEEAKGIERQEQPATTIQEINSTMPLDPINNKSPLKPAVANQVKKDRKHIMLSYQHNDQPLVLYVYEFLKKHNVRLWMDIKGGMEEHVLDSEAAAVENSSVVVCFLTQKYQDSKNCKDEFKYAKKKDKPIVPCLINSDWKPSGWLDMGIGDSLYVNFSKTTNFNYDPRCEELFERIKAVAKTEDYLMTEDDAMSTVSAGINAASEPKENPNYDTIDPGYKLNIPPSIHEGPEINIQNVDQMKLTKHLCEGDSAIRLLLTGKIENQVYANQDYFERDGKFLNYFFIPKLIFQNTSKQPISVIEITAEYEYIDGTWRDCEDVKISPAVSNEDSLYEWLPNTTINLEPLKAITFALRVDVQVHGNPGYNNERRSRAHRNLPQPFKIRLHLQDAENKTVSLIVEQLNDPLNLTTKEKLMKTWDFTDVIAFLYADDCIEDERYWALIHCEDTFKLQFSFGNNLSSHETKYLNTRLIRELYNEAKKNALTEIVLTDWNNDWRTSVALFDKETFNLYGVRIKLTTATSKTIETILLPLEKIKEGFATENSTID